MSTFRIRTIFHDMKPVISVSYDGINFLDQKYCGDSWCSGSCGLPALVLKGNDAEYKTHSDMVACGPVFQRFRVEWSGSKEFIPESAGEFSKLIRMWWR